MTIIALLYIISYFASWLLPLAGTVSVIFFIVFIYEYVLLFRISTPLIVERILPNALSNNEKNTIEINITSSLKSKVIAKIIEELPFQLQERNFLINAALEPSTTSVIKYTITPKQRGIFAFGSTLVYIQGMFKLCERRLIAENECKVKVYPSFLYLKKNQLIAQNELRITGSVKKYRRGVSTEFDTLKEYTRGDDVRTINWKASARKNQLIVNSYMDEKSQSVYCIIDKGRLMKMPFNGLTLLDYAINSCLMLSSAGLKKQDKIGLITFAEQVHDVLPANRNKSQFNIILETLYNQKSNFLESNYEDLYSVVTSKIKQRSLLILYTHFETFIGFERQLPYLRALNKKHLLCVVFFENTEISSIHSLRGDSLEDIYIKTIADKFVYEQKRIVSELEKLGILSVHTRPEHVTINALNKYLELKSKQEI